MRVSLPRPRRRLVAPFLLVVYPLCWLVVRAVGLTAVDHPTAGAILRGVVLALGAVVVAALVAVAVAVCGPDRWTPALSTGSGLLAGSVTLALAAYVVVSSVVILPQWLDVPARVAGVVVGWPMAVVTLATYAVGNAVPAVRHSVVLRLVASLVGATLTAGWVLLLSDHVVRALSGRTT
ncbi:hypothetical protein [Salinirubrum litoreum]|uniref:Yip1 domain-containing protein n=1 Tax=Salinirubrum litoreum TaxID=1126234 RepID=A0ABD5RAI6_9EURY|nr:hypothetical protein [Salinirubrum litoreum]